LIQLVRNTASGLLLLLFIVSPYFFTGNGLAASLQGTVTWIYDGDTVEISDIGRVRLLGIDSPEWKEGPRDASYRKLGALGDLRSIHDQARQFNISNAKGRLVTLEVEKEQRDRYNRLLAYVYLPDGRLLNQILIERGLAVVYRRFAFGLKPEFLAAEEKARQQKIGIWSQQIPSESRR